MSKVGLTDLPYELLELIFSFVPKSQLFKWKDIPEIHDSVMQSLYTTIVIPESRYYTESSSSEQEVASYETRYGSAKEDSVEFCDIKRILKFIKSVPKVKIKTIIVGDDDSLKNLLELITENLHGVDTKFSVGYKGGDPYWLNNISDELLQKYSKLLFSYRDISTISPRILQLVEHCRSLSLNVQSLDAFTFFKHNLPYLRVLDVASYNMILELDELKLIPRQLVDLTCILNIPAKQESDVIPNFPPNLERLDVSISSAPRNVEPNIVRFDKLHRLKYIRAEDPTNSICILPEGILEIDADTTIKLDDTKSSYSGLRKLSLYPETINFEMTNKIVSSKTLEDLSIIDSFFGSIDRVSSPSHKRQKTCAQSIPLSRSLRRLEICPDLQSKYVKDLIFDFNLNTLPKLESLEVDSFYRFSIIGEIPRSVQSLKFGIFEFEKRCIKNLENLKEITFNYCRILSEDGILELPDNVNVLKINLSELSRIHVTGKSLKRLDLTQNDITCIDENTLVIPDSVEELSICYNRIKEIESSTRWPRNLKSLYLHGNRLAQARNFPSTLKKLSLADNNLSRLYEWSIFPEGLEFLDLTYTHLRITKLKALNFEDFHELKELKLRANGLLSINAAKFPTNLEFLDLSENRIQRIHGNFKNFEKLEEIDLRKNNLNPEFKIMTNWDKIKLPITDVYI